jgi:non-specific protein-tyrosine kinase
MDSQTLSDDLRRYTLMAWRWAWLLILSALLSGGVAYMVSSNLAPVYQVSTLLLVNEPPASKDQYSQVLITDKLAQTYSEMLLARPVLVDVGSYFTPTLSADSLRKKISVKLVRDTQLLRLQVEDTNPQRAADVANLLVQEFITMNNSLQASRYSASKQTLEAQLAELSKQIEEVKTALSAYPVGDDSAEKYRLDAALTQYQQTYTSLLQSYEAVRVTESGSLSTLVVIEPAIASSRPVRPDVGRSTFLAAAIGLLLAGGVILLIEVLDDTIKGPDDVIHGLGLTVLGIIPDYAATEGELVTRVSPRSSVAEAYRSLRTNIQFATVDKRQNTLLVTSPSPSEGKTNLASNLGVVLAQGGHSVVLIDSDLRRPRLHQVFQASNRRGLSGLFVRSEGHLTEFLQPTAERNLRLLTSGNLPPNPSELLGSERMNTLIQSIVNESEMLVIDTPPTLAVTDALVLAPRVDGVLVVLKSGTTKMAAARQCVSQLQHVGANVLGVVLNGAKFNRSHYYHYYRYQEYYKYYEGGESKNGKDRHPKTTPLGKKGD